MDLDPAIEAVHTANRCAPNVSLESQLLQLRANVFNERRRNTPRRVVPTGGPDGVHYGLPIVAATDLNVPVLRQALTEFGALHVRALLDESDVVLMREVVDQAIAARDAAHGGGASEQTLPWYTPSNLLYGGDIARWFARTTGVLAIDSPRGMFHLLELFYRLKLDQLATEFFRERPALSAEKTMLRQVLPGPSPSGGWHQDGRFLGGDILSLNMWIALSDCGVNAPGLQLVPKRLHRFVETAPKETGYSWTVFPNVVEQEFPGSQVQPEFNAGDALLFDHFLLHRTWYSPHMTKPRYALESWFFAPSAFPETGTGLHV